jgi:hypothetical protein
LRWRRSCCARFGGTTPTRWRSPSASTSPRSPPCRQSATRASPPSRRRNSSRSSLVSRTAARARNAFYATHKPVLPLLVLARRPDLSAILHVDADCCFLSPAAPLFEEIGDAPVALSPHHFSPRFERLAVCGRFNAGFIYWRHDATGVRCLQEYREDCLAWCEPHVEADGRFMNQGYLTRWPDRYPGVHVIRHPGVNLAYWNIASRTLTGRWPVAIDGRPLICYHFSGIFLDEIGIWRSARREFGPNLGKAVARIYRPYLKKVRRADRWLRRRLPELGPIETGWLKEGEPVGRGPWPRSRDGRLARACWHLALTSEAQSRALEPSDE